MISESIDNLSTIEVFTELKFSDIISTQPFITIFGLLSIAIIIYCSLHIIIAIFDNSYNFSHRLVICISCIPGFALALYLLHSNIFNRLTEEDKKLKNEERTELAKKTQEAYSLKRRMDGCQFKVAEKKAINFIESTGFTIVQTNEPYYSAIPYSDSDKISCVAEFSYYVKVNVFNSRTGDVYLGNRIHYLNLRLERYEQNLNFTYEFTTATIEDRATKKTYDLLK